MGYLEKVRNRIMHSSGYAEITNCIHEAETARNRLRLELEQGDYLGFNYILDEVESKYNAVIDDLNEKARKLKEEEKRKEAKRKQSADIKADMAAKAQVEVLKKKHREEEEAKKRQAEQIKPLESLKIDKVFSHGKEWDDVLSEDEKGKLTNDASIVYYYLYGGECTNSTGRVDKKTTRDLRTRKDQVSYEIKEPDVIDSKWIVIYIPSMEKVFWQWKDIAPVKLFEHDDAACLCDIVFGGKNDGYKLYKKRHDEIVYVLCWETGSRKYSHYYSGDTINMNRYKPNMQNIEQKIEKIKNGISNCSNAVEKLENNLRELDCSKQNMITSLENFNSLNKKFKSLNERLDSLNKEEKKALKELPAKIENERKSAYDEFVKYNEFKDKCEKFGNGKKMVKLGQIKESDIKTAIKNRIDTENSEINKKKKEIGEKKQELQRLEEQLEWQKQVRERIFTINVIGDKDVPAKHHKGKSQAFGAPKFDSIQSPTGVNGN